MRLVRRVAALVSSTLVAAFVLGAAPAPAHALILADVAVRVRSIGGGWSFCFTGDVDPSLFVAGVWHVELDGWREDGSFVGAGFPLVFFGPTLNVCANVLKDGTWRGAAVGTVTYVGAGIDLASTVEGYAIWSPETGDRTGDGQTL